jgi:hypothetical protein
MSEFVYLGQLRVGGRALVRPQRRRLRLQRPGAAEVRDARLGKRLEGGDHQAGRQAG